jgi:hypothetical protein
MLKNRQMPASRFNMIPVVESFDSERLLCGRSKAVYRKFKICRICFRTLANEGKIPGVKKASW